MAAAPWIVCGRAVGADRAAAAEDGAPLPLSGSQAAARPPGAARDPVRAAHRDRLAPPAARARLRLRCDLLAAPRRVAAGRRVGAAARAPARALARRGGDRVVAGGRRLQPGAGEKGGAETGPSPVDRADPAPSTTSSSTATGSRSPGRSRGGNRNDITQLIPLVDRVPAGPRHARRRPRRRPETRHRRPRLRPRHVPAELRRRGITARDRPPPDRRTAPGSAASAGSSSAPSPGCTTSSDCSSATTAEPRSTRPSSPSAAASSASGGSSAHCESTS